MTTAQHCANCGSALREGAPFCPSCGARVEGPRAPAPATRAAAARRSNTYYLAIGGAIAVAGVVALLLLAGGGGGSSGSQGSQARSGTDPGTSGQPQTGATPLPARTPAPVATAAPPPATPTPVRPTFDPSRAEQLTLQVLNAASRIRGAGAEGPRNSQREVDLGVTTESYKGSTRPECANVVQALIALQQGRASSASIAFYRREVTPGGGVPNPLTTVGSVVEGMFAQVHVFESATQVTANIDRVRNLVLGGELPRCIGVVSSTTKTYVLPAIGPGAGGYAWAYDETYQAQSGRVNAHWEEYAWAVDNLLIRVTFQGLPGFVTPDRVRDGLAAVADAAKQVGGR